ncbi:MAG: hypothetical protein JSU57_00620 [Candidatus Heimdallarchaeota archaeon]|nr:MAG: hypothetical protein JSU57_00620 [Candidatus Heimdallarchaeota archaeon]
MSITKNSKFGEFTLSSILLVLLLVTPSYSINYMETYVPSEPHTANAMWIEPSSVTAADIGDKFNVTVFVNVTLESFAWQVKLHFNSTSFNVTKIGYTNGTKSDFFSEYSPMPVTPRVNNEEGYILHGESLFGNDGKAPGYGSLIWVEFNLTQIPPQNRSTLRFSMPYGIDTFILTPYIEVIPMASVDGANISMGPTGLPPFPDINILIVVAIVVVIVIVSLVIMRKRRRRKPKKHEKNEN